MYLVRPESLCTHAVLKFGFIARLPGQQTGQGNHDAVVDAEALVRGVDAAAAVGGHLAHHLLQPLVAADAADDEEAFEKWLADGAPVQQGAMLIRGPEDMLNAVDSMNGFSRAMYTYTVMEEEGLFHGRIWEPVLARLVIGYSVLQEENQVRKYALTAALLKKALTGCDGGWAAVVRNPRGSAWWGKRLKN